MSTGFRYMKKTPYYLLLLVIALSSCSENIWKLHQVDKQLKGIDSTAKTLDVALLKAYMRDSIDLSIYFEKNNLILTKHEKNTINKKPEGHDSLRHYPLMQYDSKKRLIAKVEFSYKDLSLFPTYDTVKTTDGNYNVYNLYRKIDDYFLYKETYYLNGVMQSKSVYCAEKSENAELSSYLGFYVGKEYIYNRKGELIKTIDNDEGYKFSYKDIFFYCWLRGFRYRFTRDDEGRIPKKFASIRKYNIKRKIWEITWSKGHRGLLYTITTLDAATGKVMKKQIITHTVQ